MRANDEDPAPSWTLQYALLQPPAGSAASSGSSDRIRGTPTPPYAMLKQIPELTAELASKAARELIVASAVINVTAELVHVSVERTPATPPIAPSIEPLNHWT